MKRVSLALGLILAAAGAGGSAPASAQAFERYVEVYGQDPCPVSSDKEIVVCARKPESDRYRIPERLRESTITTNQSWADRAQSIEYVGRGGTNSCSTTGGGGWTGCWSQLMRDARQERKKAAADEPVIDE